MNLDLDFNVSNAAEVIRSTKEAGGALLILSGAGMSVASGVPVFRNSDGSMSEEFLKFLGDYNAARAKHGLEEAPDWFQFSVPEMFDDRTAHEAWQYWRWRVIRAKVEPAQDYQRLMVLVEYFGEEKVFVRTSNCDMLHETAGMSAQAVSEIHGSLGRLQCSTPCSRQLYPADQEFVQRLVAEPDWVPLCPQCQKACLRPNVMIFGDHALVHDHLRQQEERLDSFVNAFGQNLIVLEVGAGTVVPSIRYEAEQYSCLQSQCMIRVNPSEEECSKMQSYGLNAQELFDSKKYIPLCAYSNNALTTLCMALGIPPEV